ITRHPLRIETIESGTVILPLTQDCVPTQAGLRAFEDQELEQLFVIVLRHAPFFIVIADRELIVRPFAACADLILLIHAPTVCYLRVHWVERGRGNPHQLAQRNSKVTNLAFPRW